MSLNQWKACYFEKAKPLYRILAAGKFWAYDSMKANNIKQRCSLISLMFTFQLNTKIVAFALARPIEYIIQIQPRANKVWSIHICMYYSLVITLFHRLVWARWWVIKSVLCVVYSDKYRNQIFRFPGTESETHWPIVTRKKHLKKIYRTHLLAMNKRSRSSNKSTKQIYRSSSQIWNEHVRR